MPRRKQEVSRLSVPVTSEQKTVLEEMADENKVSIARVLQEAVKEFIERHPERGLRLFDHAKQGGS
jgi:predicted transcriptional regulator